MRAYFGNISLSGLAVLFAAILYMLAPATPIVEPDSLGYVNFDPGRTAAYPFFIQFVGLANLIPAQIMLNAGCALVLAITIGRTSGNMALAHVALLALFINPEANAFQYSILSEGLFLPVSLLFLSALMVFAYRGTAASILVAAALAGLAVAARPLAYPLIAVALVAIFLRPGGDELRRKFVLAAGAVAAFGAVVGIERGYARLQYGDRLTSLAGRHIFAKASLIDAAPIDRSGFDATERRLATVMETEYAPVRAFLRDAEGTAAYPVMQTFYETCIQHGCSNRLRAEMPIPPAAFNRALVKVGQERLLQNPAGFLRLAVDEYLSLWVIFSRRHPAIAPRFDAYMAAARPVPLADQLDPEALRPTDPSRVALVARPAFMAAGVLLALITLVFGYLVLLRRDADPLLFTAWLCAVSVEGMSVFIALTGLGEGRYTMGMWPNIVLALLLAAQVGYAVLSRRVRSRRRPVAQPVPAH